MIYAQQLYIFIGLLANTEIEQLIKMVDFILLCTRENTDYCIKAT